MYCTMYPYVEVKDLQLLSIECTEHIFQFIMENATSMCTLEKLHIVRSELVDGITCT